MKNRATSLFIALLLCGCSSPRIEVRKSTLAAVDTSDGISRDEAYSLGLRHLSTYGIACGGVSPAVDIGDYWSVTTLVGIAAIPREELVIRKTDGYTEIRAAELKIQK